MQIGLYIHIPFCVSKCPYCDFNSVDGADQATMGRYLDALCAEVDALSQLPAVRDRAISTVFVGGGTPTIYGGDALGRLLEAGRQSLSIDPGAEITVEANPGTVSQEKLCRLRDAGYNRLSIGVQSLQARI
ncbi:MAG: YggW family oxidoreductase, partial [Armatimonadetes bacterium CG_4_9_14_3_um_filter_58_7]